MTPSPSAGGKPTVLLTDDDATLRQLARLLLESSAEFTVVAEASGALQAIEAALQYQPDVIVLDLTMPGMDGLEALPLLKQASLRSLIVVLSGFDSDQRAQAARAAGADGYVEKRALVTDLVAALNAALAARD